MHGTQRDMSTYMCYHLWYCKSRQACFQTKRQRKKYANMVFTTVSHPFLYSSINEVAFKGITLFTAHKCVCHWGYTCVYGSVDVSDMIWNDDRITPFRLSLSIKGMSYRLIIKVQIKKDLVHCEDFFSVFGLNACLSSRLQLKCYFSEWRTNRGESIEIARMQPGIQEI